MNNNYEYTIIKSDGMFAMLGEPKDKPIVFIVESEVEQ